MALNDKQIRPFLINYLSNAENRPQKVMEELSVCYGDAIADVVTADNILHCYEIKGETDTVQRIQHQGRFYNKAFLKITLVTTENHIDYALKSTPAFWGIMLATTYDNKTVFTEKRSANINPDFSGEEALHTLWKDELLAISKEKHIPVKEKMSKRAISQILAENLSNELIANYISNSVQHRTYSW